MDQIYQLQQQIQRLRQEINNISQMTSQLQQFEQNNASQLQQLHQHEVNASQQLQRIQQVCNQINNDLNLVSGAAQQVTQSMSQTGNQFGTAYAGGYAQQPTTFGSQFTTGQTGMMGNQQHYQPNYTSAAPLQQQRFGAALGTGSYQSPSIGFAQTYANQGAASSGYASQNQFGGNQGYNQFQNQLQNQNTGNQSFAQNQLISQQAQQAMANRMNQNISNQGSQFGQSTYNPTF